MKDIRLFLLLVFLLPLNFCSTTKPNTLWPIEKYPQNLDLWFPESDIHFSSNLWNTQEQRKYFSELKKNFYGTGRFDYSPWSATYIQSLLSLHKQRGKTIFEGEQRVFKSYSQSESFEGMNFRPYTQAYFFRLYNNINFSDLEHINYSPSKRAIIVHNTILKPLPTKDPFFRDNHMAGEGYPFDYNNFASLLVGTPVYILSQSNDKSWSLVVSPVFIGWIPSRDTKLVKGSFIQSWQKGIKKHLGGILGAPYSIVSSKRGFLFYAYIGTLLPVVSSHNGQSTLMVPVDSGTSYAHIETVNVPSSRVVILPLTLSRKNFKNILSYTIGRTYGWGNINFHNDCSSELRYIYFYFGVAMPRNSLQQSRRLGNIYDFSSLPEKERYKQLSIFARPLLSLITIPGHVMLYLGVYNVDNVPTMMSYQELWGLRPPDNSSRYIVGQSVIFPLLNKYKEKDVISFFDNRYRKNFKIISLEYFHRYPPMGLSEMLY